MSFDQVYREHDSMSSTTPGLNNEDKSRGNSQHTTADEVVAELVAVVRELHQLLESYAPVWFTRNMDDRMSKIMTAADWVPRASGIECTPNK